jgi:hypothetical protein
LLHAESAQISSDGYNFVPASTAGSELKYHRSWAVSQASDPSASATARPDDRRLRADRQHVRTDRRDRPELGDESGETEQPGSTEQPGGNERDILTGNGE